MYTIYATEQFRTDLDSLEEKIRKRIPKTIRQISENPHHPGLRTEKQAIIRERTVMRSRVSQKFRLLWEWLPDGAIGLWRVGNHEFIDAFKSLPGTYDATWNNIEEDNRPAQSREAQPEWVYQSDSPQPFKHCPVNFLRLFGVPDEHLENIQLLTDPELIWDLALPEGVKFTLYDIWMKGTDWSADAFLNTKQLLYRTNVDQLEGYCEGKIKRLLLNLSEEQLTLVSVKANGPILIKGVAGSGKTTIGLYRAQYLAGVIEQHQQLFEEKPLILLLTYSKTLAKALRQLFVELYGSQPSNITIDTYSRWMLQQLFPDRSALPEGKYPIATKEHRQKIVHKSLQLVSERFSDDKFIRSRSPDFLLSEVDEVIRARGLTTLDEYLSISRVGRGVGLDRERHRPIIWEIYLDYQAQLDALKLVDFSDLPRILLENKQTLPKFDVVIIDEAQDLTPMYLRLASELIKDFTQSRSLTLLADPAQSIYYHGIAWKEAGINVRGRRTKTLQKNFRNSQQILEAAQSILEGCDDLKLQNEYIPPTATHRFGPKPVLLQYDYEENGFDFIINSILKLCQSRAFRPGDIAILARFNKPLMRLKKLLAKENIPWSHYDDKDFNILENEVKLVTMHSAKGLEFPVVFLIDLTDGVIPYIRSLETEEADLAQERKLFYVSMTRASERLFLLHPKRNRCRFIRDLSPETITMKQYGTWASKN